MQDASFKNSDSARRNELLSMHEFYSKEAHQQRTMMWDTVKWFTPILIAIHSAWLYSYQEDKEPLLFILAIGGILLSFICLNLLHTFYRTNLIYVSMFIKVENELNLNTRMSEKIYFPNDENIVYKKYLEDRINNNSAYEFVTTSLKKGTMHRSMQYVFFLFIAGFVIEFCIFFWKQIGSNTLETYANLVSIILGLMGTYLLAFSLKIKSQYSIDLVKLLKLEDRDLVSPTEVKQKNKSFWWGLILLTFVAMIQFSLAITKLI
ncbi:MAG: hypothetical protein HY895_10680 [Deltaproteobacteria bacterium]|nr:hypothetical protein [Deltaproteobacteria bacterium]